MVVNFISFNMFYSGSSRPKWRVQDFISGTTVTGVGFNASSYFAGLIEKKQQEGS
jgi:hypothetical protein